MYSGIPLFTGNTFKSPLNFTIPESEINRTNYSEEKITVYVFTTPLKSNCTVALPIALAACVTATFTAPLFEDADTTGMPVWPDGTL